MHKHLVLVIGPNWNHFLECVHVFRWANQTVNLNLPATKKITTKWCICGRVVMRNDGCIFGSSFVLVLIVDCCCCCCCFFSVVFVLFGGWFLVFSHQRHKDYVNSLRMSTHYKSDFYTNIYCFYFPMDFVRLDAEQCALAHTHTGTRTHTQHTSSILYVITK